MLTFLLLLGVLLNVLGQLLLKAGMMAIGYFEFSYANVWPIGLKVVTNPYIAMGITCYVLSVATWLLVLSRMQVSIAYPLLSIGYIANAVVAYYLFGEPITSLRVLGILIIIIGVTLVTRSA